MLRPLMVILSAGLLGAASHAKAAPAQQKADFGQPVQRVSIYGPSNEMRVLSNLTLSREAQNAFDEGFSTATYFGAFAVAKDGGWGFAAGANSLAAAHEIAMQECLAVNTRCIIHTEIVPVDYIDPAPGEATLASLAATVYTDPARSDIFHAMAVSEDGAYFRVWGHETQAAANTAALSGCEENRIRDLPIADMPCVLLPRAGKT